MVIKLYWVDWAAFPFDEIIFGPFSLKWSVSVVVGGGQRMEKLVWKQNWT